MAARRLSAKKVPVQIRSVLVGLPEDKMLALSAKSREVGESVHELCARILSDWLDSH